MQVCKLCGTPNASIFNSPSPLRLTRLMLTTEPTERGKNLKRMLFHSRAAASRSSFLFWSVLFFSMLVCPPLPKKAINNNTKGRKRYKQSAERKNKVPFVLSLGSCFGERLKSACLMCLNKSSFMREKRGEKAPSFFEFFQSIKFFLMPSKKRKSFTHYARDI